MIANPNSILLSSTVSVLSYREMESKQDRTSIARFIKERFTERYVFSLSQDKSTKNGFAMTALACLMMESLESFWHGWPDTRGKGAQAFKGFFHRNSEFSLLAPFSSEFYANVRCGLLHQAETTGGWRIRRQGPLFNQDSLTVNAALLLEGVHSALLSYCDRLSSEPWTSDLWEKFRAKMNLVCNNAIGAPPPSHS
jgi:hypothetical protein